MLSVIFALSRRERMSLGPPGTNGAMKRIGLFGYPGSAATRLDATHVSSTPATALSDFLMA